MANPGYVRSTDGDNADDGSTWALANADSSGAIADASAGDRIWYSDVHNEASGASTTLTFPGTAASPNQLLCGDDAAEPPTALATTAVISTSGGNYYLRIEGSFYAYGLQIKTGVGASGSAPMSLANDNQNFQSYDTCGFELATTSVSADFLIGNATSADEASLLTKNCTWTFNDASQQFKLQNAKFRCEGGSIAGSAITELITAVFGLCHAEFTGVDLSAGASTMDLVDSASVATGTISFRNCKLPGSWTGTLWSASPGSNLLRVQMINCSSSDTNYALWVEDYAGSIKDETTLVKDSGASDGTTALSWKMTTTANAEYPAIVLKSPEIQIWQESVGSSVTVTVDFLHDSVTNLQDNEIWLEVEYLGTAGFPLSLFIDDAAADVLTAAADQTASSATWTTTGMSNPNEQKLSVSFTPQEKGLIIGRVHVAKTGPYTIYVDPLITVS